MSWKKAETYHTKLNKVHQQSAKKYKQRKLRRQEIRMQRKIGDLIGKNFQRIGERDHEASNS